jgi:hypothetical protein
VRSRRLHGSVRRRERQPLVGRLRVLRDRDGCLREQLRRLLRRVRREHVERAGQAHRGVGHAIDRSRRARAHPARLRSVVDLRSVRSGGRVARGGSRDPVPRQRSRAARNVARAGRVPGARRGRARRARSLRSQHLERPHERVPHHDRSSGRRVSDAAVRRGDLGIDGCRAAAADVGVAHQLHRSHGVSRGAVQRRAHSTDDGDHREGAEYVGDDPPDDRDRRRRRCRAGHRPGAGHLRDGRRSDDRVHPGRRSDGQPDHLRQADRGVRGSHGAARSGRHAVQRARAIVWSARSTERPSCSILRSPAHPPRSVPG